MEKQRENRCPNQIVWHLINEAKLILEDNNNNKKSSP